MRIRSVALASLLFFALPARADVDLEHRIVEDTGFVLKPRELKLGLFSSSYGLGNHFQLDSYLLADLLTFVNAGVKYQFLRSPQLNMAIGASGGLFTYWLARGGTALYEVGGQVDTSWTLSSDKLLHVTLGARYWGLGDVDVSALDRLFVGRIAWLTARASMEWDVTRNHVLFFTLGTPTSWLAASSTGAHDFDATDFWQALAGYQFSYAAFNIRLDLGYGASLFGRGLVGALDLYVRF